MGAPYYRFFPADYDRDTKHLSLMQHGAYRLLIDLYMNLGPIGNDMERINRTLHATSREEQAAVEYVLVEFFVLNGGQWTHKRCDKERAHTEERRQSAQSSAAARWHAKNAPAEQTECERIADAEQTQCDGNANQNQNQNQRKESANKRGSRFDLEALPLEWEATCRSLRSDLDPNGAFERFRDYWIAQPGAKGVKANWLATWRNWVRNERSPAKPSPASQVRGYL